MNKKIVSPCISICKTDPVTGYCYGCARTEEEKKIWKDEKINDEWKKENLKIIISRMKGWQLTTFKDSYDHKIKEGVSLFKKNMLKKKL
jgi:Predicted Fe-S protein